MFWKLFSRSPALVAYAYNSGERNRWRFTLCDSKDNPLAYSGPMGFDTYPEVNRHLKRISPNVKIICGEPPSRRNRKT